MAAHYKKHGGRLEKLHLNFLDTVHWHLISLSFFYRDVDTVHSFCFCFCFFIIWFSMENWFTDLEVWVFSFLTFSVQYYSDFMCVVRLLLITVYRIVDSSPFTCSLGTVGWAWNLVHGLLNRGHLLIKKKLFVTLLQLMLSGNNMSYLATSISWHAIYPGHAGVWL